MEPIRIMVLGMSGAGKTVYLASLYQKLSVQREGYALTTDASISARLNKAYNRVRDPALEWPSGTRSVDYVDVPFDCVINNPARKVYGHEIAVPGLCGRHFGCRHRQR